MNLDDLLARARRIESETTDAANTARRVGSLLADLIGALRSISDDSLSSLVDDEARGHIIFARGLTSRAGALLEGGLQVGTAAAVDASGRGTLQSLVLREWLEVPELRLNRTAIHLGASLLSPGAGIVAEVEVDADARGGHVTLKLEAGEAASVVEGDLLMGIFSAPNAEWGAVRDADNGRLDVQFAGFATAYFEVAALDADRRGFRYTLRPDTHVHPRRFMTFASRGNRHDAARGKFCFSTRSYTRYLSGVQSWDITASHVVLQLGELDTLRALGFSAEVGGVGLYAENAFLSGRLRVGGGFKTADEIVEDQTLHIEYSIDGSTSWHATADSSDRFMRQRRGSGAWSAALPFGRDGRDGAKGDPGTPGRDGQDGRPGKDGRDGAKGDPGAPGKNGRDGKSYTPNLLDNSAFTNGLKSWWKNYPNADISLDDAEPSPVIGTRVLKILPNGGDHMYLAHSIGKVLRPSTTYTFSVWSKQPDKASAAVFYVYGSAGQWEHIFGADGDWQRFTKTFTTPAEVREDTVLCLLNFKNADPKYIVYFAAPKLEVGATATAWTSSEADRKGRDGEKGEKGDPGTPGQNGLDGTPGVGVQEVVAEFATGDAAAPKSEWSTNLPPWTKGLYLWRRERITYTDGRVKHTPPQRDDTWAKIGELTAQADATAAKADAAKAAADGTYTAATVDNIVTTAEARAIVRSRIEALRLTTEAERARIEAQYAKVQLYQTVAGDVRTRLSNLMVNYRGAAAAVVDAAAGLLSGPPAVLTEAVYFQTFVASSRLEAYKTALRELNERLGESGNFEVGGRNLFGFTKGVQLEVLGSGFDATLAPDIRGVRIRCTGPVQEGWGVRIRNLGFERPGYYTASATLVAGGRAQGMMMADFCDQSAVPVALSDAGKRLELTGRLSHYTTAVDYNGFLDLACMPQTRLFPGDLIELRELMIERGTIPSPWCKAEEDTARELADTAYLRTAFEQAAGITGGILFGAMLQMRDVGGQVTAYVNGLRSLSKPDGTGRPALALGVDHFAAAGETEVTALHFDGSGHIGKMNVRTDGSIFIPPSGANGAPIPNSLPMEFSPVPLDVPALLKSTYFETRLSWQASSATVSGDAKGKVSQRIDLGTLNVERDYGALQGKLKVSVRATTKWLIDDLNPIAPKHGDGGLDLSKEVRWDVRLMLTNDSDAFYTLFYAEGRSLAVAQEHPQTLNLPNMRTGAYKLVAYIQGEYADTLELKVVQEEQVKYVSTNDAPFNAVRSNGFVSYQNPNQHVYIQDGVLHVKGAPDMPGVLVAGSVRGDDGLPTHYWGHKGVSDKNAAKAGKLGNGIYRVYHQIGYVNYSLMVTPYQKDPLLNPSASILQKYPDCVDFVIREGHTSRPASTDFDFVILGLN